MVGVHVNVDRKYVFVAYLCARVSMYISPDVRRPVLCNYTPRYQCFCYSVLNTRLMLYYLGPSPPTIKDAASVRFAGVLGKFELTRREKDREREGEREKTSGNKSTQVIYKSILQVLTFRYRFI